MKKSHLPKNKWIYNPPSEKAVQYLSNALAIPPVISALLVQRGLTDSTEAYHFLHPSLKLLKNPFLLNSMDKAIERIKTALRNREKVLICGDYDVDGITSAALLKKVLNALNLEVAVYLPNRFLNGYGFHNDAVEKAVHGGATLIITVDCGISSHETVHYARTKGIDVIITDHHEPMKSLPDALAVINPKRSDSGYPDRDLAGIGVVFKLVQALIEKDLLNFPITSALELVALGTIADVAPLTNENRILVYSGLEALTHTRNPGLMALKKVSGIPDNHSIDAKTISYQLGPRINAAGRMGAPDEALHLLLTRSNSEAIMLASKMDEFNKKRHMIEEAIIARALDQVSDTDININPFIVIQGSDWHEGVIGIVASKIADMFYRPTCIISIKKGVGRGSGRSIPEFSLFECLNSVSHLLLEYGGHHVAAGFQIKEENINGFRHACNSFMNQVLTIDTLSEKINIDSELTLDQVTFSFLRYLQTLKPFGLGNPSPKFLFQNLHLRYPPRRVGSDGSHLKLVLTDGDTSVNAIAFGFGNQLDQILSSERYDIIALPEINVWRNRESIQLNIIDIAPIQLL